MARAVGCNKPYKKLFLELRHTKALTKSSTFTARAASCKKPYKKLSLELRHKKSLTESSTVTARVVRCKKPYKKLSLKLRHKKSATESSSYTARAVLNRELDLTYHSCLGSSSASYKMLFKNTYASYLFEHGGDRHRRPCLNSNL